MTQPRSTLVSLDATPWYHVVSDNPRDNHPGTPTFSVAPGVAHSGKPLREEKLRDTHFA